ncbi:protein CbbY [Roseibium aquae]|uniref:Protein CbbY n=1 Tax=Roseibium aquae TaxID=1323746 RepID=A0A916TC65_9HYPH|nr:HAD-IA family hydrolase [Roseibium aquae]GGB39331.1 protein CbbY [Roseibium aquae]
MTKTKVILFGSIGTLAETSEWQREAFNRAFGQAGLEWAWDLTTYRALLRTPGGQNRIAHYGRSLGQSVDAAQIHALKTQNFHDMLATRALQPRAGVLPVLDWASKHGIKIGLASTTSRANIDALLNAMRTTISRDQFIYVGDASRAARTKPAPDIYMDALDETGFAAADAIAIENTAESLTAALRAGVAAIAFPGENAWDHDFTGAVRTVNYLSPELFEDVLKITPVA